MTRTDRILTIFSETSKAGGGIHDAHELAMMLGEPWSPALNKLLADSVNKTLLRRVTKGLYESTLTPPDPTRAIFQIINKLRRGVLNYISLESQLSHTGDISQILIDRVTVMTKGRSGTFSTPYGVIEFTHTKRPVNQIAPNLYFDPEIKMYRAKTLQAIEDLKHCDRNLHMLENDHVKAAT